MNLVIAWLKHHFSNHQLVILALLISGITLVITTFGNLLMPLLASIVIAYLLEGIVAVLERFHSRRILAVIAVWVAFMAGMFAVALVIAPLLYDQFAQFVGKVPEMIRRLQEAMLQLPQRYPNFISEARIKDMLSTLSRELGTISQRLLAETMLTSMLNIITIMVYLVLMPFLVFFMLKDKSQLLAWIISFLPKKRELLTHVWLDIDIQMGNYVRGKFIEILMVWAATYLTFSLMGLDFAMMLGVLVGLSVIIPYIGAVVVTFPVVIVAFFQFGFGPDFTWIMIAYTIIQAVDGNIIVPLLFSEVVHLHPIAIVMAVLVFGGIWGFWGVFFAIPLATVVQAVIKAWPRFPEPELESTAATV